MKILYLSQLVPYPMDAGPKVRIYHVLQYLASAGHEITLLAFHRPEDGSEGIAHMREFCREVRTVLMPRSRGRDILALARSLAGRTPFLIGRDRVPAMHQALNDLLDGDTFDAIHADQLWMAQYALAAAKAMGAANRPVTVLDQHNAVYLVPERLAAATKNPLARGLLRLEGRKMANYELATCRQFDHVVWLTEEDRGALDKIAGDPDWLDEKLIIPICVDPATRRPLSRKSEACRVTFMGGMHWPPNQDGINWFAREVWPRVLAKVPHAMLTVIGKNPPAEVAHRQPDQDATPHITQVEATGFVKDPSPYLEETAAFIVPLRAGGGMRVKILDAWTLGLPVVSTTIGAEGLDYQDGQDLLLADDPAAFAEGVASLLLDRDRAAQLAAAGRATVERAYDWRDIYRAWDRVYGTV